MHTDRHEFLDKKRKPFPYTVDENGQPLSAKDIVTHFDPEFETKTFGDARMASRGRRGRIPSDLHPGDYVFFYSGLAKHDPNLYQADRQWHELTAFQIRNKPAFLIGYLKVRWIFDIKTKEDLPRYRSEIENNAHFKEQRIDCTIIKGEDESKLLDKAVQLNYWDLKSGKYRPTNTGGKIGLRPTSGMRITKWLDETFCKELLEIMSKDHSTNTRPEAQTRRSFKAADTQRDPQIPKRKKYEFML